jgi:hypothetical protein
LEPGVYIFLNCPLPIPLISGEKYRPIALGGKYTEKEETIKVICGKKHERGNN